MAEKKQERETAQRSFPAGGRSRAMLAAVTACSMIGAVVGAETPYFTVQAETVTRRVEAYAQVQPIAVVPVKAPAVGIVSHLALLPGASVQPGDLLATLTGPDVESAIARAEAAVKTATAKKAAATKTLAVLRTQLASHLSTAQQVAQAEVDVADATGALATASADLETARLTASVRSPIQGKVIALSAAVGERVAAGDVLLTLEPTDQLWVTGVLYGADASAVHVGDHATFKSGSAENPVAVNVVSIAPTSGGAGDVTVGLRATEPNAAWRSGEYGTLKFQGTEEHLVGVPTQALILDQGKWWVLAHTAQGDKPIEVVPGPARGWQTLLRRGIAAGTQIVAQNAYLEYHREIASRYQPPD